ncbi:tryptophan synthase subunit beta like protein [Aidingimonas halophila]|uniref:Tryptophan synthase subunit beta like protein n=1 Tax=Aidingimonas halophila TaxID=574349 RepID=A0A1H3AQS9_9GAMM|nr:tryptophan synthase subunit beta like protein [Aidingimonas halophila]GHC25172.1 hypothetical protein GCM10008094_15200 [Aidingimonas halophila]SDX32052.1 hypothetical protein SAMN05443545_1052 [Aidingimonas halophila]
MFVKRDEQGTIVMVCREASPECREFVESDSPELSAFLGRETAPEELHELRQSDLEFVRVLEDVIEILMDKGVISFTDLPDAAREKLMARQSMRQRANSVGLLGDDGDDGVI